MLTETTSLVAVEALLKVSVNAFFTSLILLLTSWSFLCGSISPVLNYQGNLRDAAGNPYPDGTHSLTFSIYADSVGGTALWSETQSLDIKRSLIHAYL